MSIRIYVGINRDGRKVFKSETRPTWQNSHDKYGAVWGPFRTMRGARFGASPAARNNPHVQTVADAERIAKSEQQ